LDEVFLEVKVAKLTCSALMSLDAFIADQEGKFDWAEPGREVHAFLNDLEKQYAMYLYGRSMYEVM
jgi:dihydrofolate reductase